MPFGRTENGEVGWIFILIITREAAERDQIVIPLCVVKSVMREVDRNLFKSIFEAAVP